MLEKLIVSCLSAHYGIQAAKVTLLALGADRNARVYRAQTLNQTSYFIKVKSGHHPDTSSEIAELLRSAGVEQIIPPIKTLHGKLTHYIGDSTLIVYPFVDGQDGFHRALTEAQWIQLGKALKQIHALKVPSSMQNRIQKESYSAQWRDAVRSIYTHVETKPIADEVGAKLQLFMRKHLPDIKQLVDRAEQLGKQAQEHSPPFVLCHSDIHAGNVLMEGNTALYIVDWDDPIMAPKERDLMFVGGGVGNVWNKPHEETLFYEGYGKTEIDPLLLAYYRHERIVEDIAEYSRELLLKAEGEDRLEMYKHFIAMFEPQGVVDIAFKN